MVSNETQSSGIGEKFEQLGMLKGYPELNSLN